MKDKRYNLVKTLGYNDVRLSCMNSETMKISNKIL